MRSSTALHILDNSSPLQGKSSQFLKTMKNFNEPSAETPRALRTLARIIENDLCHRCGSCVGICPTSVLSLDKNEFPTVENLSACTDCDLCVKVCPGDEFNWSQFYTEQFGSTPPLTDTHGFFQTSSIAHSTNPDIRSRSTSGGVVTELLLSELEAGNIQGAIVIGSDTDVLWKGKAMIATTREQILAAMKSKYAICATNSMLSEIRKLQGKFALVGLPCQIHGFRKASMLDSRIKDRIAFTIGLFCHAAIDHEAFRVIWDVLGEKTKDATQFVSRIGKHPGAPHLKLADGSLYPIYFGDRNGYKPSSMEVINILYRLYTPGRCMTCFDALSEFADISVGDPWLPPPSKEINFHEGWSFVLTRTNVGTEVYERTISREYLKRFNITEKEARSSNRIMTTEKRWRAFRVIETLRRQGRPIPEYQNTSKHFPGHSGGEFIKTELHMLSHAFCFLPQFRSRVLRFMLTKGYWLFWINNKRRILRDWLRDTSYNIRVRLFGRS